MQGHCGREGLHSVKPRLSIERKDKAKTLTPLYSLPIPQGPDGFMAGGISYQERLLLLESEVLNHSA